MSIPEEYREYADDEDQYDHAARLLVQVFTHVLAKANEDPDSFRLTAADVLRRIFSHRGCTPEWLSQVLNEGKGEYKP